MKKVTLEELQRELHVNGNEELDYVYEELEVMLQSKTTSTKKRALEQINEYAKTVGYDKKKCTKVLHLWGRIIGEEKYRSVENHLGLSVEDAIKYLLEEA